MLEPTQSEAQHLDTAQNIEPAITGILFLPVGVSVTTSDCRGTVGEEEEEERARRPGYTAGEERTGQQQRRSSIYKIPQLLNLIDLLIADWLTLIEPKKSTG